MEWTTELAMWVRQGSVVAVVGAFLGGLLASLTPCTYPLIPLTVSFFGHQAAKRRMRVVGLSVLYISGMSITYTTLGLFVAISGKVFGFWVGSAWLHIVAGNICLISSLVMAGWIHLSLPKLPSGRVPSQSSMVGAFFMGIVSSFLLGPCTTPILGVVLATAAVGADMVRGAILLVSFSLGLGFFVVVLSVFFGLLASLPRSGPWLRWVQHGCAFLMLVLAQYFFVKAGTLW